MVRKFFLEWASLEARQLIAKSVHVQNYCTIGYTPLLSCSPGGGKGGGGGRGDGGGGGKDGEIIFA